MLDWLRCGWFLAAHATESIMPMSGAETCTTVLQPSCDHARAALELAIADRPDTDSCASSGSRRSSHSSSTETPVELDTLGKRFFSPAGIVPHPHRQLFSLSAVSRARSQTLGGHTSAPSSPPSSMTTLERRRLSEQYPWTRRQKINRGVWAAGFAAIILVGTFTGAQLKADKQKEEAIQEFRAIAPAEQIALLQARRAHLVEQRAAMQRKLDGFREKMRERQHQDNARGK